MTNAQRILTTLCCLALALPTTAGRPKSFSFGGGPDTAPPVGSPAPLANLPNYNPTVPYVGLIPTFITSTVSERFLLVLRLENGQVVGVTRAETRQVVLLRAPAGETLRLDVFPLDGAGQPIVGIPVQVGVSVAVSVGAQ